MIPAIQYPARYYDAPEGVLHCECSPCAAPRCNGKMKSMDCAHGENDITCEHRFCAIDSCGDFLRYDDADLCEQHQLIHDMVHAERRK